MIFANAHINVAPSGYMLEKFHEAGFNNVEYIPNPVDLSIFTFKKRELIRPRLLWVRSLSPIYNPEMMLKVVKRVSDEFPDCVACMIGPDKAGMLPGLKEIAGDTTVENRF